MIVDLAHFLPSLLLAGLILRFLEVKLAGTSFGKALSFIY